MRNQVLGIYTKTDKGLVGKNTTPEDFQLLAKIVEGYEGITPNDIVSLNAEVAKLLATITGGVNPRGFYSWLLVNYDDGNGVNSNVIKQVVNYLLGTVNYKSLISMIAVPCSKPRAGRVNEPLSLREEEVEKLDPFKLLTGLGGFYLAKFLLRFGYYDETELEKVKLEIEERR